MADPPVQEMPVQSLITTPSPNDIISAIKSGCESISVKGQAHHMFSQFLRYEFTNLMFFSLDKLKPNT